MDLQCRFALKKDKREKKMSATEDGRLELEILERFQPRFELGLLVSESNVLTTRPWNQFVHYFGIVSQWNKNFSTCISRQHNENDVLPTKKIKHNENEVTTFWVWFWSYLFVHIYFRYNVDHACQLNKYVTNA